MVHVGWNDINNQTSDKLNTETLTEAINIGINIGKFCINFGVTKVIMLSVLPKTKITLLIFNILGKTGNIITSVTPLSFLISSESELQFKEILRIK